MQKCKESLMSYNDRQNTNIIQIFNTSSLGLRKTGTGHTYPIPIITTDQQTLQLHTHTK